ncbi:glycosyltransferase family 4 protein [Pontiellaceae bacterium B12219]|nr:glycosyltransferase family 4 protein [Pontiellaceae bacterium B12219]
MKVLVCQRGARHRYSIPRIFEEAGMLAGLYTDSTCHSTAGKLIKKLPILGDKVPAAKSLEGRVPKGIPGAKIFSSDRPLVASALRYESFGDLSPVYKHWGLQNADVVYSMYGEDMGFLSWAKEQGAKIIIDIFISPLSNQVVWDEQVKFDTPERYLISEQDCRPSSDRGIGAFAPLADILLCPSEWVADGVRQFVPDHAHKIRVVPYGSSILPQKQCQVDRGRILFAGRDPLRKGLPYLAEATKILKESGMELDVRVAGLDQKECAWFPHYEYLNYLGLIEMNRMKDEFTTCDAFVLPSLSEGQAGVVLEAMAHGCPVIATKESGIDFSHNENGVFVPACDADVLASSMRQVVEDRSFREKISAGGQAFFEQHFSVQEWKTRLVNVVNEFNV